MSTGVFIRATVSSAVVLRPCPSLCLYNSTLGRQRRLLFSRLRCPYQLAKSFPTSFPYAHLTLFGSYPLSCVDEGFSRLETFLVSLQLASSCLISHRVPLFFPPFAEKYLSLEYSVFPRPTPSTTLCRPDEASCQSPSEATQLGCALFCLIMFLYFLTSGPLDFSPSLSPIRPTSLLKTLFALLPMLRFLRTC